MVTGGKILAKSLEAHGVRHVFCVAGESYLPVLDGLLDYPDIKVITCRHESGASFMAEAYANLENVPGVAMVTRGPGACNGSIGVHTARQSATPMIYLVGLVNIGDRNREAFQEFDLEQMFGSLAKWCATIDELKRIPEYIARAFRVATSGKPGPVVLGLPEDVLFPKSEMPGIKTLNSGQLKPAEKDLEKIRDMLAGAQRPVILAGGGGWSDEDCENLASFANAGHIPVTTSFRRQDLFNHNDGNYIGELGTGPNPALVERVKQADVVLALGARLNEITTQGYSIFSDKQKLIHVYPSEDAFGQAWLPDLAVQAHIAPVVAALAGKYKVDGRKWAAWRDEGRKEYQAWTDIPEDMGARWDGADMSQIFRILREKLPEDAIITTDAGNFSGWCQRYLRYGRPGRLLAPVSGAMGYAVPSVIAASLARPSQVTVGFCGDGGFMMSGQEIATAVHHGARPIIIVCNNSMYGTIRMHQEKHYPGRVSATGLTNPDFVKLAESYGAYGARVEHAKEFENIWNEALESGKPALIEIRQDPRQITTNSKL